VIPRAICTGGRTDRRRPTRAPSGVDDQEVDRLADEYFAVTEKLEALYDTPGDLRPTTKAPRCALPSALR
jgi:hypothetical protein